MAIYGYCRVSTARQADEGESLDVQQRQLDGYAKMNGMDVAKVFVERGISGSKPLHERPEGSALLAVLQPGDVILTAKLDRMFRSALDALDALAKLKADGISLHMLDLGGDVTGNGISRLVFTILSAVAEAERERIRERVTAAKADARARGMHLGGSRPFGFSVSADGHLEPIPAEAKAIEQMKAMHADGYSLRKIAEAMGKQGHGLSYESVRAVLSR